MPLKNVFSVKSVESLTQWNPIYKPSDKEVLRITLHQCLNINSILPPLKLKIEFHLIPKGLFSSVTRPDWGHFLVVESEHRGPCPTALWFSLTFPGWIWWMGIPCGSLHHYCSWWRLMAWATWNPNQQIADISGFLSSLPDIPQ